MKSHNGIIVGGEEIQCKLVLELLDIPELDHNCETPSIQKVDLSLLKRFDIACGEVKYFEPETIISKCGTPTLESSLKPKCCTCIRSHDKSSENCRWLEELRREQSQFTAKSINLLEENINQLTLLSSEGERLSTLATSMVDNVVDSPFFEEDYSQKISTVDIVCSREGSSYSEIDKRLTVNDDSSNYSTSSDSCSPCTPIDESRDNTTTSLIPRSNLVENFSDNIDLHEEKSSKTSVVVVVNSKQKYQHLLNIKSCSNSCTPKSQEMSNNQLSILMGDDEVGIVEDAEERRKSLICAAKVANLPKFKWGNLDFEDLDNMLVVSKNENIDTKCALSFEEFCKDVALDAQEIVQPVIEQKIQGFDSLSGKKEQKNVFIHRQQTNFPRFVILHFDLQGEVDVLATKSSIHEDCNGNQGENFFAKSSEETKMRAYNVVTIFACESQSSSGLALLAMGKVDFRLSPIVVKMNNVEVKKLSKVADSIGKQYNSHNRRDLEQIKEVVEFSYIKQLKEYWNLAPKDFVKVSLPDVASVEVFYNKIQASGGKVPVRETSQFNKHDLKEEPRNKDVLSSNDMDVVPVIVEASCEDFRPKNIGVEKVGEGKEQFQRRLWCYLFENMNKTIDELYFLCELESDVEQIKEVLLVLDEASVDFKDLKARVNGSHQVKKGLDSPRLSSVACTNKFSSTKVDLQQRQPHLIAWEAREFVMHNFENNDSM